MTRINPDRRQILRMMAGGVGIVASAAVIGQVPRVAGLATANHDGHDATPDAEGTPGATPEGATPAAEATASVSMANLLFDPAELTIAAGTTVIWTNEDEVPHTVTGEDRVTLQSGTITAGSTFSMTFDTPGTFAYSCEFHAGMNGTVVVT